MKTVKWTRKMTYENQTTRNGKGEKTKEKINVKLHWQHTTTKQKKIFLAWQSTQKWIKRRKKREKERNENIEWMGERTKYCRRYMENIRYNKLRWWEMMVCLCVTDDEFFFLTYVTKQSMNDISIKFIPGNQKFVCDIHYVCSENSLLLLLCVHNTHTHTHR